MDLKTENVTDSEEFSCWASHFSAGILCVLQGKMVQRSAKRPAVRACWQFSDALYKQNAPISGSEISGKAPAGQTCPCRAQPGNRSPLHIHSQQKRCGNTGLLTCVREQMLLRPHPTFSQVFPAMADISSRRFNRFGVASRAQHRFVSALWPSSCRFVPVAPRFASRFRLSSPPGSTLACITVSPYKIEQRESSVGTHRRKTRAFCVDSNAIDNH